MIRKGYYCFFMFILLTGCSTLLNGGQANTTKDSAESMGVEIEVATDAKSMIEAGPGKYVGRNFDQGKIEQELLKFPEGTETKEAYSRLVSLMAEDYIMIDKEIDEFDPSITTNITKPGGVNNPEVKVAQKMQVEILLDTSGSMAQTVHGKRKMDMAKASIEKFVSSLPQGVEVGLRIYGHKGSNRDSDKSLSCNSNEMVYGMKEYDGKSFGKALDLAKPVGWTPLAKAIQSAKSDFSDGNAQNVVYIVSDGVETCDGDPVAAAKSLHESNIEAVVNIIGLDMDNKGQVQLKEVAFAGGGKYIEADNEEDMQRYFDKEYERLKKAWSDWRQMSEKQVDSGDTDNQLGLDKLIKKKALGLVDSEYQQFKEAISFLADKGKIQSESGVLQQVSNRKQLLRKYFIDRDNKIESLLIMEEEERLKEIQETEKQQQEELDKKIGKGE
ncbi:VWA domain-containing protein [Mechercharimyces sp. CAU 1602]|uniref:VWA domain-containing protein n=1 Tax=Mechercharimyces sp. CAU 1602 TaxID=2973933 RepID=UPI00216325F2|nr:VWA domain-containing protein [Mechercharimyces sp. CAU 1602]MCS1350047.1 VWA domain-containing protein [Mechercharimyces sp. CAU 1602]